jgi:hypothetical protein
MEGVALMKCGHCNKDIAENETPVEVGSIDGEYYVHSTCEAATKALERERAKKWDEERKRTDAWHIETGYIKTVR